MREDIDTERKIQQLVFSDVSREVPVLFTKYMVKCIVDAVCRCITHSGKLMCVVLECIPLDTNAVSQIALVSHDKCGVFGNRISERIICFILL